MLTGTANQLLGIGLPLPDFFLPLAISFFTFEQISYLVDADAGKTAQLFSLLDYALFVAYFPHLIAGPIVRHNDLIPQFRQLRSRNDDIASGVTLFTIGLAKKSLIADNLAPFADAIFNAAGRGVPSGADRQLAGHAVLRLPDLFRFQRLFRHGAGLLADAGHTPAGEFPFPLQGGQHHRILAALAHFAVGLPARLSLHLP